MIHPQSLIVITGAAGFIGSYLIRVMNARGYHHLILVDDFSKEVKINNWSSAIYYKKIERSEFVEWLLQTNEQIDFIFHLGARTDTTFNDSVILDQLNVNYSKYLWNICVEKNIPFVYASSAATYGNGEHGYNDNHATIPLLRPLNAYGESKQAFDLWVLEQSNHPPLWTGLKFFNVFGPQEYHKGRMASVVLHSYLQIKKSGKVKLFKSHHPDYADGGQLRDFVYVKDVVQVLLWIMEHGLDSGIYNLGTGKAASFGALATAVFKALNMPVNIEYIDTPIDIRDTYQYFTQANMSKMRGQGYTANFTDLAPAIDDYVKTYLNHFSFPSI